MLCLDTESGVRHSVTMAKARPRGMVGAVPCPAADVHEFRIAENPQPRTSWGRQLSPDIQIVRCFCCKLPSDRLHIRA